MNRYRTKASIFSPAKLEPAYRAPQTPARLERGRDELIIEDGGGLGVAADGHQPRLLLLSSRRPLHPCRAEVEGVSSLSLASKRHFLEVCFLNKVCFMLVEWVSSGVLRVFFVPLFFCAYPEFSILGKVRHSSGVGDK